VKRYARPMPNRSPPTRPDDPLRLGPPAVTKAEEPLRRAVAMAYRTVREATLSHEDAIDAAENTLTPTRAAREGTTPAAQGTDCHCSKVFERMPPRDGIEPPTCGFAVRYITRFSAAYTGPCCIHVATIFTALSA
jgi:hypothetical protein